MPGNSPKARPADAPVREQAETEFTPLLRKLVRSRIAAVGAVVFDGEGESVDQDTTLGEYDIKLTAAHVEIAIRSAIEAHRRICGSPPDEIAFTAGGMEFTTVLLGDSYYLCVVTDPERSNTTLLRLLLPRLVSEIKIAAGL